jgi:hypothetical protein
MMNGKMQMRKMLMRMKNMVRKRVKMNLFLKIMKTLMLY